MSDNDTDGRERRYSQRAVEIVVLFLTTLAFIAGLLWGLLL